MTELRRLLVALLAAAGTAALAPAVPAQAQDSVGAGFVFSNKPSGRYGPCNWRTGSTTVGEVGPAGHVWQRRTRTQSYPPNIKVEYRTENAFRKIITTHYCNNGVWWVMRAGHPSYKVSRVNEYHQACYGDGRCYPIGATVPQGYYEKPWRAGWR